MAVHSHIFVETFDNVKIVGDMVFPEDDIVSATLLVHMMPATRASYAVLQQVLAFADIASLAIDLRGHGDSVMQEGRTSPLSYKDFSDQEHQSSIYDIRAGFAQLRELTHLNPERITLIGASIGANLVMQYAAEDHGISHLVLLSPGLSYHGIDVEKYAAHLAPHQHMLLASTDGDTYSHRTVRKLHALLPDQTEQCIVSGTEHGTDMLSDETVAKRVLAFIQKR